MTVRPDPRGRLCRHSNAQIPDDEQVNATRPRLFGVHTLRGTFAEVRALSGAVLRQLCTRCPRAVPQPGACRPWATASYPQALWIELRRGLSVAVSGHL